MTIVMSDLMKQIISFVETHPGCARRDIAKALDFEDAPHIITNYLGILRRNGIAVNQGGEHQKHLTRWYMAENAWDILKREEQRARDERLIRLLVKNTGCTPNAAKTALSICASSASYIQEKGEA